MLLQKNQERKTPAKRPLCRCLYPIIKLCINTRDYHPWDRVVLSILFLGSYQK